jgi:ABC-type thiamin/hydroxymethylpyrimidine transport system permease subunit
MKLLRAETWRMSTMDLVLGAVLGALNAAWQIVGGLGFVGIALAPVIGGMGVLAFAFPFGLTMTLPVVGGYLRRSAGVAVLVATLTGVLRWLFGDPNGVTLVAIWFVQGLGIAIVAEMLGYPARWGGWALGAAVGTFFGWIIFFLVFGTGFITQEPVWLWVVGMFAVAMISAAVFGGALGIALARLLTRAGLASAAHAPATTTPGPRPASAA